MAPSFELGLLALPAAWVSDCFHVRRPGSDHAETRPCRVPRMLGVHLPSVSLHEGVACTSEMQPHLVLERLFCRASPVCPKRVATPRSRAASSSTSWLANSQYVVCLRASRWLDPGGAELKAITNHAAGSASSPSSNDGAMTDEPIDNCPICALNSTTAASTAARRAPWRLGSRKRHPTVGRRDEPLRRSWRRERASATLHLVRPNPPPGRRAVTEPFGVALVSDARSRPARQSGLLTMTFTLTPGPYDGDFGASLHPKLPHSSIVLGVVQSTRCRRRVSPTPLRFTLLPQAETRSVGVEGRGRTGDNCCRVGSVT